jgi:hypothetical protein
MFPPPFPVPGAPPVDPAFRYASSYFPFTGDERIFTVPSGVSEVALLVAGGVANIEHSQFNGGGDALYVANLKTEPGRQYRVRVGGSPGFDDSDANRLSDDPFEPHERPGGWNGGGDGYTVPVGVESPDGTRWRRASTAGGGATTVALGGDVIATVGGEPGLSWLSSLVPPDPMTGENTYTPSAPYGPTLRRIVGARPTATQSPRAEYTPAEAGHPFDPRVLPAITGGESGGGNSFRVIWPRTGPLDRQVTTITGAGGGGYGGGCSGIVVDTGSFPGFPPGPPTGFLPLRGNFGGTHIKAPLFNAWVHQAQLIPSVLFLWPASSGGALWRIGHIGWGSGQW